MHILRQLVLLLLLLSVSPTISAATCLSPAAAASDVARWCSRTPHPKACRYYLSNGDPPTSPADFLRRVLQLSFDLSRRAQSHLRTLGRGCRTRRQRTAWLDCYRLYANTAIQLNRTLRCAGASDAQTWLSAALTNLETCHKGFAEIGANSDVIVPVTRYNVTDLISNSLALNNATNNTGMNEPPPTWTSVANRRLLQASARARFVVAKDGSGTHRSIKAALDATMAVRKKLDRRVVIHIKAGIYSENVVIVNSLENITMTGAGKGKTIITGSRSIGNGYTTFSSPTFSVFGDGFIATGITFRNTFGPGYQAVAFLSGSDRSVFYRCGFEGYQDTLCVFSQRQFYRECDIYGTIDFIFGNAAVVFQKCNIFLRRPRHGESNVITAQGRVDPNQNTGIVIQFSNIKPAPDLRPVVSSVKSFLGRPWQTYARTVYMQNYISGAIDQAGWLPGSTNGGKNTLYFAEFKNNGPGSKMSKRVRWPGYHAVARPSVVRDFTVGRFIAGRSWLGQTGVPFSASF